METILTVLVTLGVLSLIGTVWGVVKLNKKVDDLEVAIMDIDDEIIKLRKELEDDIEHIHREMGRDSDNHNRNLDSRLDKLWTEVHKLFSSKNK